MQAYLAHLQDFLSAIPRFKMRGKWTETGETFLEEEVIEWIAPVRDDMNH